MAGLPGAWTRVTSFITGAAIGGAAEAGVVPVLEPAKQNAWLRRRNRIVDPIVAAEAVAQGLNADHAYRSLSEDGQVVAQGARGATAVNLRDDVARQGFSDSRYNLLVGLTQAAPPIAEALKLWRRGRIDDETVNWVLAKERIPQALWPAIRELHEERLDPAEIANAVQQGFLPNDGILPLPDDTGPPFTIPVEEIPINPHREAEASGINAQRLAVEAQLAGLPPGPMELLSMWNRGLIDENAVNAGIREGHTKTKWRGPLKALRHPILSGHEFANLRLKGWLTRDEAKAGGALSGYSETQMDQLWQGMGRPATTHQAYIGARRGGSYDGPTADVPDYFKKAVIQSNLRPEWTNLLWAQRHTYPSAFVLRALTQGGDITQAQAEDILKFIGWPETLAASVAKRWAEKLGGGVKALTASTLQAEYEGGFITQATLLSRLQTLGYSGAEANLYAELGDARRVISARTSTLSAIRTRYVSHRLSRDEMLAQLGKVQMRQEAKDRTVVEWDIQREATVTGLTAAQIRSAYRHLTYTRETALQMLDDLGWRADQAAVYLDTPAK